MTLNDLEVRVITVVATNNKNSDGATVKVMLQSRNVDIYYISENIKSEQKWCIVYLICFGNQKYVVFFYHTFFVIVSLQ